MSHLPFALRITAAYAVVFATAGCGYTAGATLDEKYQTIHVAPFYNQSKEYGLQAPLTNAISRKFVNDARLTVVERERADLLLEGVVLDYVLKGLTFDENDDVTQFLTVVTAGVRVTDTQTGEILWQDPLMAGETSYYTRAIGASSDRLRGNAEAFVPTVRAFPSPEENRAASEALEQLASDIYYRTIEPW